MERMHQSVLLQEVIEFLNISESGNYFDGTFGEGGHSEAILKKAMCQVVAFDRDKDAIDTYQAQGAFKSDPRLKLIHARFSSLNEQLPQTQWDGAILDLGVSTRQLLTGERGFSFSADGPLDMRMDKSDESKLSDYLEALDAEELANALYANTGMHTSRAVGRRLKRWWAERKGDSTAELAKLFGPKRGKTHPATEAFMGLRMLVNEELQEIERAVPILIEKLKPGARLVVITFHSTEDRLVKRLFQKLSGKCICGKMICECTGPAIVKNLTKKVITASQDELERNPRARSAKLRCVEKLT